MSQIVIAKRYAKALLNLAEKEKALETVSKELLEVTQTFTGSQELQSVLADTKIPSLVKTDIVNEIIEKQQLTPLVSTFLQYLMSKRRIALLGDIEIVFSQLVREKLGILEAEVTVAKQLSEDEIADVTKQLSEYSGKKVHVSIHVDNSIIGGIVTRIGSVVIDGSLRNQLTRVYQSIIRG